MTLHALALSLLLACGSKDPGPEPEPEPLATPTLDRQRAREDAQRAADRARAIVLVQADGLEQLAAKDKEQDALQPDFERAREAVRVAKPADRATADKQLADLEARWDLIANAKRAIRKRVDNDVALIGKLPDRCFARPTPIDCQLPAAVTREPR